MRPLRAALCSSSFAAAALLTLPVVAAEVDARPPDKLAVAANGSTLTDTDGGAGGSVNWLHYFTPDAIFGVGAEHQIIDESNWTFGSLRAALSGGESPTRTSVFGEVNYGEGTDDDRKWDYFVGTLGVSHGFTSKFSAVLESRQIEIDTTHGNLPKLSLSYLWTPRVLTTVAYAQSVGGNLGTELTSVRIDYYGNVTLTAGGAWGQADPSVVNVTPGLSLPAQDTRQAFVGIGKTFSRGEILLLGDYLELEESEKVTVTLVFTAYLGTRGR